MHSPSLVADPGLPRAAGAAAGGSFEAAFDRCAPSLRRYFAVRLGDPHRADDFMQQLWLQARTAPSRPPPEQLEFWLRAIARNLVHACWRRAGRDARRGTRIDAGPQVDSRLAAELAERLSSTDLPPELLERREVCDQLLLALTELAAEHQELIVAHYFRGVPFSELAGRHGLSERAIEGRLYRARSALREKLKHLA